VNCMDKSQNMHYEWFDESFSRPLFKHLYKDNKDLDFIASHVCKELGLKQSERTLTALKAFLLDLYLVDKLTKGEGSIGVFTSDGKQSKKGSIQYSILKCGRSIFKKILSALEDREFILIKSGNIGHSTKIKAEPKLVVMVERKGLSTAKYKYKATYPIVFNQNNLKSDKKHKNVPKDVARDFGLEELNDYSKLLLQSDIAIGDDSLLGFEKRIKRVFTDSNCNAGGRIYGPIWQRLPKKLRGYIKINGKNTVELDIITTHPLIAYALAGKDLTKLVEGGDSPYRIRYWQGKENPIDRVLSKKILLILFNTSSKESAEKAIRKFLKTGGKGKVSPLQERVDELDLNGVSISDLVDGLVGTNTSIRELFFSEGWKRLNKIESEICIDVSKHFTNKETAILTVHDSFIIQSSFKEELRSVIIDSIKRVLSVDFFNESGLISEEIKESMSRQQIRVMLSACRTVKTKDKYRSERVKYLTEKT